MNKITEKALEAIYARIPNMKDCKGKCEDSCTVIPCSSGEKKRIEAAMGQEFKPLGAVPFRIRCSALTKDGKCSQYALRPVICRVFGTSNHPMLRCEHGCVPERWLTGQEVAQIMLEVEALCGEPVVPNVPGWPRLTHDQAESMMEYFL